MGGVDAEEETLEQEYRQDEQDVSASQEPPTRALPVPVSHLQKNKENDVEKHKGGDDKNSVTTRVLPVPVSHLQKKKENDVEKHRGGDGRNTATTRGENESVSHLSWRWRGLGTQQGVLYTAIG